MSQNNTQAPGIGDIYSRGASSATNGTVVPGMHKAATDTPDTPVTAPTAPVVGFLYSISRKGIGEYWPVHIGRNKIGRDADCDVILKEGTVSGIHALLNVNSRATTGSLPRFATRARKTALPSTAKNSISACMTARTMTS